MNYGGRSIGCPLPTTKNYIVMIKAIFGAVISALAGIVNAVALCRTCEPVCIIFGCLAVMVCIGCISEAIERGGAE